MLKNYLLVFFISMVPIVELRGAIPIGLGLGLPALPTYFCACWATCFRCPSSTVCPEVFDLGLP